MNNEKIKKLERISRELITSFIFEELEDSEKTFWIITVTNLKISSDLSYLDIFVSSLLNGELLTMKERRMILLMMRYSPSITAVGVVQLQESCENAVPRAQLIVRFLPPVSQ